MFYRYVPPITSNSPNFPETKEEITKELEKQDSLLSQIHAEMHAGFVTKKREEQLWDVQRIITQLKRKLRSFDTKKSDSMQKSVDDGIEPAATAATSGNNQPDQSILQKAKSYSDDEISSLQTMTIESNTNTETKPSPQDTPNDVTSQSIKVDHLDSTPTNNNETNILTIDENGLLTLPTNHPDYLTLLRYQLENQELINWKNELQARITTERAEVVRLKHLLANIPDITSPVNDSIIITDEAELEKLAAYYLKENASLEQKKEKLARDIFNGNHSLIQMQVELELQKYKIN